MAELNAHNEDEGSNNATAASLSALTTILSRLLLTIEGIIDVLTFISTYLTPICRTVTSSFCYNIRLSSSRVSY